MDTGTAPEVGSFSHLENWEQWFPSLTFDGYRVKKTRPTDYIETTVMQPVKLLSTGSGSATTGATSTQPHSDDDILASTDHPAEAVDPSTHDGDTLWLQMGRRSSIKTTDGSVTPLAPRVDSQPAGVEAERRHEAKRKYDHTVRRRKQALTLMALASSIVTIASLAALAATIF